MGCEHPCKLTMLPAMDGDCFVLEFGSENNCFRMMIDSGTVAFGNKTLKPLVRKLMKAGQQIDLLLITHFDSDHIGGALSLLRDDELYSSIKEIWHNGLRQVAPWLPEQTDAESRKVFMRKNAAMIEAEPAESGGISAKQSYTLSKLIRTRQLQTNNFIGGAAITGDIPVEFLGPSKDVEVFFLLPTKERLDELLDYFENFIPVKAKLSLTEECEESFDKILQYEGKDTVTMDACAAEGTDDPNLEEWAEMSVPQSDSSKTNASSIAIIIRYHGKKFLFPGDAVAEDLIPALEQWRDQQKEDLYFDVVKLPHHGSNRNCMKLLELDGFDGKLFLISTDGFKHGHPNKEALAKLVVRKTNTTRVLAFNYQHAQYQMFNHIDQQKKYQYIVTDEAVFSGLEVKDV